MTDIDLGSRKLFTEQPSLNNYVTISAVISSGIPLANVFNGQTYLMDIAKNMISRAQSNAAAFSFNDIQKVLQFKMYKVVKPKVIFSAYISRVLTDSSQSNIQVSQYYPVVQFKIDYDACCVGSMMLLITTDIQVRGTLGEIPVHGYNSNGNQNGVTVQYKDVKSIQYQYCSDFIYHYIDRISIGWANTGGNAPIWHQELPIEVVKIYHTLLSSVGMSATINRANRNDMFTIGHDAHRQFGDFSTAIKSAASIPNNTSVNSIGGTNFSFLQQIPSNQQSQYGTSSELALYWNDTEIKEIGFGGLTNTDTYSSLNNIQIMMKDPKQTGSILNVQVDTDKNKTKHINKMQLSTELYWKFGSDTAEIVLISEGESHIMTNSMSYIPIVSSVQELVPIINGLNTSTKFPYYINTIDATTPYTEIVYLIPYVIYSTTQISFSTSIICKLSDNTYKVPGTAQKITLNVAGDDNNSIMENPFTIQVSDGSYSGMMQYNLDASTNINNAVLNTVNTIVLVSNYDLSVSNNNFSLSNMSQSAYFLDTTLKPFNVLPATAISEGNDKNAGFKRCLMSSVGGFNSQQASLLDFVQATSQQMGSYLLQSTGALSPVMQQANIAYINIMTKPYDQNDLVLNSTQWYTTSNGANLQPQGSDKFAIFRYNSSIAANLKSEENYPCIQNVDDISIHTYRKNHGIVDFYLPLQCLFICQDISQSFPHYACSAQSILVKIECNSPFPFINTSISVNPLALDPMDYNKSERLLINRVNPRDILQSNVNNTKFILFYTRYAWVPQLQPILANYKYYSWVINNYERYYKTFNNLSTNQEITIAEFNKANFYTRIWVFIVNRETVEIISNRGNQTEYVPISVNRFKLELWDKMRYGVSSNVTSQGAALTGSSAQNYINQQNSVYFQVPFESCKMVTKSSINMTDDMPYRAQLLYPYLMLEHQMDHSALEFNNLLQFNIDGVFYQEGFPNCMYCPAYAPDFAIKCTTKSGQQQDFGAIIIPEYKNVAYITSHIMLLKYSANQ